MSAYDTTSNLLFRIQTIQSICVKMFTSLSHLSPLAASLTDIYIYLHPEGQKSPPARARSDNEVGKQT